MKVFVLGLDGATWDVLEPLIQDGLLPNLARLREHGSWGSLNSVFPPLSPVAWTGVMTGKNSGKHGIFEFIEHSHNPLAGPGELVTGDQVPASVGDRPAMWQENRRGWRASQLSSPACQRVRRILPGRLSQPGRRPRLFERPGNLCRAGKRGRAVSAVVDLDPRRRQ